MRRANKEVKGLTNNLRNYLWLLKPDTTVHIATSEGEGWLYAGRVNTLVDKIPAYILDRAVDETYLEANVGLVVIIDGEENGVL